MRVDLDELWSIRDVANQFGISTRAVMYAIRTDKLKAHKVGWVWLVQKSDLPQQWPPTQ